MKQRERETGQTGPIIEANYDESGKKQALNRKGTNSKDE